MKSIPLERAKDHPADKRELLQKFQEILFSMNVGFAITYGLFAYDGSSRIATNAPDVIQRILETFSRFRRHVAPFTVHLRTKSDLLRDAIVYEAFFVALVLSVALLLYFLVRLCVRSIRATVFFAAASGLAALIAVPCCWLYIVHATWGFRDSFLSFEGYGSTCLSELVIAAGLVYFFRDRALWYGTVAFTLHYAVWIVVIGERDHGNFIAPVLASLPLSIVFPLSGFVWLRYVRMLRNEVISQGGVAQDVRA
jgi:hypothetical protein